MTKKNITPDDITIRNHLEAGDIGRITYMHGMLYNRQFNHNIRFEAYVAESLADFYYNYDPKKDRVWICEHEKKVIGSLVLQHREEKAQLRYFLIHPGYRGIGLGNHLMERFMAFLEQCGYPEAFLLTSDKLYAASALYRKHGFDLAAEEPSDEFGKPLMIRRHVWKSKDQ
jgi:N-acetylglutamate synthase-like GNAT family acetyltransferase